MRTLGPDWEPRQEFVAQGLTASRRRARRARSGMAQWVRRSAVL